MNFVLTCAGGTSITPSSFSMLFLLMLDRYIALSLFNVLKSVCCPRFLLPEDEWPGVRIQDGNSILELDFVLAEERPIHVGIFVRSLRNNGVPLISLGMDGLHRIRKPPVTSPLVASANGVMEKALSGSLTKSIA